MVRRFAAFAVFGVLFSIVPGFASAQGNATEPFSCETGFHQVIGGQLAQLDPAEGSWEPIGAKQRKYNAMAYREADGFLYAVQRGNLLRIDRTGASDVLGRLREIRGSFVGEFGDDGLLYVSKGGRNWHAVDVDTLETTRVTSLDVRRGPADVANVHGVFYGISNNGTLWSFDPVAGTATEGPKVEGLPQRRSAYGAAWATAGGNLYIGRNTGELYQVTGYSGDAPVATQVGTTSRTRSNDGASCALAFTPPGLADVDGPESETQPSTPEKEEAADRYEEEWENEQEHHIDPDDPNGPDEVPVPDEHEDVDSDGEQYDPDDTPDVEAGDRCEANVVEARLPRVEVGPFEPVAVETELYSSDFGTSPFDVFRILNGEWLWEEETLRQAHDCGFDTTVLLDPHVVEDFRFEATFAALTERNHGGLLINQSSPDTRSGAGLIDLAQDGSVVRIGFYDDAGFYQQLSTHAIEAPGQDEEVTLAVVVHGRDVLVEYNGDQIATERMPYSGGHVGLVVNATPVSFETVILTQLPPKSEEDAS